MAVAVYGRPPQTHGAREAGPCPEFQMLLLHRSPLRVEPGRAVTWSVCLSSLFCRRGNSSTNRKDTRSARGQAQTPTGHLPEPLGDVQRTMSLPESPRCSGRLALLLSEISDPDRLSRETAPRGHQMGQPLDSCLTGYTQVSQC